MILIFLSFIKLQINCVVLLVLLLTTVAFTEKNDNENEKEPFHPHRHQTESMFLSSEQDAPAENIDERPRGITFEYAFSTSHSRPHSHEPPSFEMNVNEDSDSKFPGFNREPLQLRGRGFERQAHEFARQSLPSYSGSSSPFTKDSHSFQPFPAYGRSHPLPSSSPSTSPFSLPSSSTTTPYSVEPPSLSKTPSLPHITNTRPLANLYLKNYKHFDNLKTTKTSPSMLNYITNSRQLMRRFGYDNEEDYEEPMFNDEGESMYNDEAKIVSPSSLSLNPDSKVKMVKVIMGEKNDHGKPWGSKTMLYYHDPKLPDNYMHLTEMKLNMNSRKHSDSPHHDVNFEIFNDHSKTSAASKPPYIFEEDNYEPGPGDIF